MTAPTVPLSFSHYSLVILYGYKVNFLQNIHNIFSETTLTTFSCAQPSNVQSNLGFFTQLNVVTELQCARRCHELAGKCTGYFLQKFSSEPNNYECNLARLYQEGDEVVEQELLVYVYQQLKPRV